jgi:nucleotidyltransferase/DNA polymerase involved in DNA repair
MRRAVAPDVEALSLDEAFLDGDPESIGRRLKTAIH